MGGGYPFKVLVMALPNHRTNLASHPSSIKQSMRLIPINRRMWRLQALLCGSDPSWGIAGELSRALDVSLVDLEGPDAALSEMSGAAA